MRRQTTTGSSRVKVFTHSPTFLNDLRTSDVATGSVSYPGPSVMRLFFPKSQVTAITCSVKLTNLPKK